MIKDRGSIKWTSMMLPEHVKQLRDWEREEEEKGRNDLDEQQLEEMNQQIYMAMEEANPVSVLCRNARGNQSIEGRIHYYDPYRQLLRMINAAGERQDVPLASIVRIMEAE